MMPPQDDSSPAVPTGGSAIAVAVIGAGTMGSGIAQVAAQAGHPVTLVDSRAGAADEALARVAGALDRLIAKGRIERDEADAVVGRITPHTTADMTTVPPVGLVIEAVVEHADIKRAIFRQLEASQPATTVLATNTSSIDIDAITGDATTGHNAASHGGHSPAMARPRTFGCGKGSGRRRTP